MTKNIKVIILEIVVIILAIIGLTLATTYVMDSIGVSTSNANLALDYTGTTTLPSVNLIPIQDTDVSSNTDNVLRVNFSVKGRNTNPEDKDIIYDVILEDLDITCYLKKEYFKWQLYKNSELLTSGNFSPTFDVMKDNKLYLTTIQQDLPKSSDAADNYELVIWISEVCSDATTCTESQDQSEVLGETISGKVQILLYTDSKKPLTRTTGTAETCEEKCKDNANPPALVDGLIPVTYDTTKGWVKADSTNKRKNWYSYCNKRWANAVLVGDNTNSNYETSNTIRATYENAEVGTPIPESDILAYYVWIPRYKYKVWNIDKDMTMTNNLNARTEGIDIIFESGKQSTGTIKCNYDFSVNATASKRNETCTGTNGDYYTHPAFTFGDDEVEGIWVGKFEISSSNPSANYGGGIVTNLTVRVKPNTISWGYNTATNFWKVIYDMQIENNIYGLNVSRSNTDSHMLKNMEWGAVAYLTNSKYGRCVNNTCSEVTRNSNTSYYTGGNNYIANVNQSTTGNIYGIYDMSGGSSEYVMGKMSKNSGSFVYYTPSGESKFTYNGFEKYIDTYSYGTTFSDQKAYNRGRLGDATGETKSWYSDSAEFISAINYSFVRGGTSNDAANAGVFYFKALGGSSTANSSRAALLSLSSN